jgi:hypothetical protein
MSSIPARNQLLHALCRVTNFNHATYRDIAKLCNVLHKDDAAKVFYILTWISAVGHDLPYLQLRASLVRSNMGSIQFQCGHAWMDLFNTLTFLRDPERDAVERRQVLADKMPCVESPLQAIKMAELLINSSVMSELEAIAASFTEVRKAELLVARGVILDHEEPTEMLMDEQRAVEPQSSSDEDDDIEPSTTQLAPPSQAQATLFDALQRRPALEIAGKYAFLFAIWEHDWLASQLATVPASAPDNALWRKIALKLMGRPDNCRDIYDWNLLLRSHIDAPSKPRKAGKQQTINSMWTEKWLYRLCFVWGCVPFCVEAASRFESFWWLAAAHAENQFQDPDHEYEPDATALLYLITHLVYTANAYMALDLNPIKLTYLEDTFLSFVTRNISERFLQVTNTVTRPNIELLVELADFCRAVGRPVPSRLLHAFDALTSSNLEEWLKQLIERRQPNIDGAAHVCALFERRLAPPISVRRNRSIRSLFAKAYDCPQAAPVPSPVPSTTRILRKRKRPCPQPTNPDRCDEWYEQESDCPLLPVHACKNQRLRLSQFSRTYIEQSRMAIAGNGVFAAESISAGEFVAEYTGEVTVFKVAARLSFPIRFIVAMNISTMTNMTLIIALNWKRAGR